MAKTTNSYEVIKWIPFDREKPASGQAIVVFSPLMGVVDAKVIDRGLHAFDHIGQPVYGHFSHWAKPLKGPSSKQLWIDWAVSWVK